MTRIARFFRAPKRFLDDERGSVLILFGLGVLFLVGIGGAAVDLGREQLVNVRLQQAADAAATSAAAVSANGNVTRTDGTPIQSPADISAAATRYFNLNYTNTDKTRPTPIVTVGTGADATLQVSVADSTIATSFVSNLGTKTLPTNGSSTVGINASNTSDYDVAIVFDETGSTSCNIAGTVCGGNERINAMKAAVTIMANNIVPGAGSNPNVRIGFAGYSSHITNKWGLSDLNADALKAISNLRPTCNNYDYNGFYAAISLLQGGKSGVANQKITSGSDCTVSDITDMPPPQTQRTNTTNMDANKISNTKIVVFLTDGGIMTDPAPCADSYAGRFFPFYYECYVASPDKRNYPQFLASCQAAKAINAHVYVINFASPAAGALTAMETCASATIAGGTTSYSSTVKPLPGQDYFNAPDAATLNTIFTNITNQIKKIRITQ